MLFLDSKMPRSVRRGILTCVLTGKVSTLDMVVDSDSKDPQCCGGPEECIACRRKWEKQYGEKRWPYTHMTYSLAVKEVAKCTGRSFTFTRYLLRRYLEYMAKCIKDGKSFRVGGMLIAKSKETPDTPARDAKV